MIVCTDLYTEAKLAGAKPIILAYLTTDTACRCLGKETPQTAHLDSALNPVEWSARVMAFGDYSQRLSSSDDNPLLSLIEEDMPSVTLSCDNVDRYFSLISGAEEFLDGRLVYLQGWDYPGITSIDFIQLFSGSVTLANFDHILATFTATRVAVVATPDDPDVDTGKVYGVDNAGSEFTMAMETTDYATVSEAFFTEESWTFTVEFERDDDSDEENVFHLINDTYGPRLAIGFDDANHVYVSYTPTLGGAPVDFVTDFTVGQDPTTLTVQADADANTITVSDNFGNSYVFFAYRTTYNLQWGSNGTGNGEFDEPAGIATDANGNVYVCDSGNTRVQKFNKDGTYLTQWGSAGTGNGQFDATVGPKSICVSGSTVYVTDRGNARIQTFSTSGGYSSQFGDTSSVTSDGGAITVTPAGGVYLVNNSDIAYFYGGAYVTSFGSLASLGITSDTLGNIFVASVDETIKKYDGSGTYLTEWSLPSGTADYDLWYNTNKIYVVDTTTDAILIYDTTGELITNFGESGTGDGEFTNPWGVCTNAAGNYIYVSDNDLDRVQRFTRSFGPDFSDADPGSDEYILVGEDFPGTMGTMTFTSGLEPTWQLVSDNNTAPDWEDIIGNLDIELIDGTYVEVMETETFTATITTVEVIDTTVEIVLETTENYSNTGSNSSNVIRPLPYGNLLENADEAVWGCPLINQTNFTYMVAGWPVQPVSEGNVVTVYVDGIERPGGWTFYDTYDYEYKGNVAILWFHGIDPGGAVSVRCNGKWVDGALLTNPVDIIENFMDYAANLTGNAGWEKNTTSFAQALNFSTVNAYQAAGVIQSNNSLGFWIKNIMASFLGSMSFNADGEIELSFLPLAYTENIMEDVQEYEAITLEVEKKSANVVKTVVTNYAKSNATEDRRFKNNATSSYCRTKETTQAGNTGGQVMTLNFDWNRRTPLVSRFNDLILSWYGSPVWSVDYHGQDFKFLPLELQDQVSATLSLVLDDTGAAISDKVYSLMSKTLNLDDFTSKLTLLEVNTDVNISTVAKVYLGRTHILLGGDTARLGGDDMYLGKSYLTLGGDYIRLGG